jgi:hypothetical protein
MSYLNHTGSHRKPSGRQCLAGSCHELRREQRPGGDVHWVTRRAARELGLSRRSSTGGVNRRDRVFPAILGRPHPLPACPTQSDRVTNGHPRHVMPCQK